MKKLQLLIAGIIFSATTTFGQLSPSNTPDAYGYLWRDTTYNWVDITSIGTEVLGLMDDNVVGPINMGMSFKHYWTSYNHIYIGSNGYVSFDNTNIATNPTGIVFSGLPSNNGQNNVIAPLMCDLALGYPGSLAKVYTYHDVSNNRFIITYDQVPFWINNAQNFGGSNTFQIIFDGNNNYITFNYKTQVGSWDSGYDTRPNPMVSGIENNTGQYGLFVSNIIKPTASSAIVFMPPVNPSVNITDASPRNVQNSANGGFFIKPKGAFPLNTLIANTGNVDITGKITATATVSDKNANVMHLTSDSVTGLVNGGTHSITFSEPFTTDSASSYKLSVTTSLSGDSNPGNNIQEVEMVAIETNAQNEETLSFVTYGVPNAGISWDNGNGNSGGGVYFVPYEYPTVVKAIEVVVRKTNSYSPKPDSVAYYLQMFDDAGQNGTIGQPLANETIKESDMTISTSLPVTWNRHDLSNPVIITNGGVYVAWIQNNANIILAAEDTFIISRRTYEVLNNSWAVYRDVDKSDFYIRLITEKTSDPQAIAASLTELKGMKIFPNPSQGVFTVDLKLDKAQDCVLKITDMAGRKVFMEMYNNQSIVNRKIDLNYLAKGVYTIQILTEKGFATEKMVID